LPARPVRSNELHRIDRPLRNASQQEQQRLIEKLLAVFDRHDRPVWQSGAFDAASWGPDRASRCIA